MFTFVTFDCIGTFEPCRETSGKFWMRDLPTKLANLECQDIISEAAPPQPRLRNKNFGLPPSAHQLIILTLHITIEVEPCGWPPSRPQNHGKEAGLLVSPPGWHLKLD